MTAFSRCATVASWTMAALLAAACGQAGSSMPTSPSATGGRGASTGAVINGTVNGLTFSTLASSDTATTLATLPVTVTVVGTSIATTVDRNGRFQLNGVPTGDVQLNFKGTGLDATLTVRGVQTGDLIDIIVRLSDNSIRIEADRRQPRGNDNDDDSDEDSDEDSEEDSDDRNDTSTFRGVVSNLTGTCSSITFNLNSLTGVAFKTGTATRFDSACASIQNNLTVEVRGRRQANEFQVDRIVLRS